jgi:hypothetical protein
MLKNLKGLKKLSIIENNFSISHPPDLNENK